MRRGLAFAIIGVFAASGPALACPAFPPVEQQPPGGPAGWTVMGSLKKVPPPTKHEPIPDGPLSSVKIALRRSTCYGSCPEYTVVVGGDGTVRYHGERFVLVRGDHLAKVDPEDVRCLLDDFRAADFWSLRPSYFAPITDNPGYAVTLSVDGKVKTLTDYVGRAVGMPADVTALEDAIDRLAGDEWVVGNAKTIRALRAERFDFGSPEAAAMLTQAVETSLDPVVLDLLDAGAPTTGRIWQDFGAAAPAPAEGPPLAFAASRRETPAVLRVLIARGAFDLKGVKEQALLEAARSGRPDNVREILAHHPDVNFAGGDGETALTVASGGYGENDAQSHARQVEIIRLLLVAGADAKAHKKDGVTALHIAESVEASRLLIQAGADVNAKDDDGEAPLSWASSDEQALFLLESGADPRVRVMSGGTLIAKAKKEKWAATMAWLKAHGVTR